MSGNWRVKGTLLQPAELLFTGGDHRALVCVLIEQPGGLPVLACLPYGDSGSAHYVAGAAAKRLTKGMRVEAHGDGVKLDRHRGQQVLRLMLVDHIGSLEAQADHTRHERLERETETAEA